MNFIRIHRRIDSETLHLPELKPLIGKNVEILIREEPPIPRTEKGWQALTDAAGQDLVDPDVYRQYREFDRQHQLSLKQ
jgi:hypothetical protein